MTTTTKATTTTATVMIGNIMPLPLPPLFDAPDAAGVGEMLGVSDGTEGVSVGDAVGSSVGWIAGAVVGT